MTSAGCQTPSPPLKLLPPPTRWGENKIQKLMGGDKDSDWGKGRAKLRLDIARENHRITEVGKDL